MPTCMSLLPWTNSVASWGRPNPNERCVGVGDRVISSSAVVLSDVCVGTMMRLYCATPAWTVSRSRGESINDLDVARQRCRINWPGNVRAHRRRLPEPHRQWIGRSRVVPPMVVQPVHSLREIARAAQRAPSSPSRHSTPLLALPIRGSSQHAAASSLWSLLDAPSAIHGMHLPTTASSAVHVVAFREFVAVSTWTSRERIARSQPGECDLALTVATLSSGGGIHQQFMSRR
jgi:hypothetical protein